ncbi:adenosylcobinamide-GDP ribazoletransferase [Spirochaetia bacterium]|nr:adenosylcobinamide-GDP ribazoletransferase [Spirochaetia bacterium]GHV84056.1 adenosylcobinamide-GDP ribazoletransferase [Spirochaetia bacterium]
MDFYLPVIGLFSSVLFTLIFFLFRFLTGSVFAALFAAFVFQYLAFNLFHLDGLCDTADAFLGCASGEKTYSILKDSRIGTYGLFAGITSILSKIIFLDALCGAGQPFFFAAAFAYPVSGRFASALIPCFTKPAKPDGLGRLVKDSKTGMSIAGALCALFLWLALWLLGKAVFNYFLFFSFNFDFLCGMAYDVIFYFALPFISAFACALFFSRLYKKRIGGYTGDALGASIETAEILHLFLLLIIYNFKMVI